ncbi:MAG TPA: hypothetical protein VLF18_13375 [Tahibacter sp.]|uniref:hypothetical protein n=1 Tax=Tahibacter sp. TaxID=2056211 RepID=UPI002CD1C225|nr:hypothetical protein [Tahibacter sp.]HSX61186.1 hypothetical protein [Tahibacter sp.]
MIALAAQMLMVGGAYAQTCSPNAGTLIDSPPSTITVDTCASSNQLLSACNGLDAIGASPDTIYSVQIGATATGGIAATPTGYDLKLALLQGACAAGSTCIRDADNGGAGQAENFSVAGLAAGTYFVLLTSFGGSPDCGSTNIVVTPTLPVTLQNFSVN